jgi:hypothetical protein
MNGEGLVTFVAMKEEAQEGAADDSTAPSNTGTEQGTSNLLASESFAAAFLYSALFSLAGIVLSYLGIAELDLIISIVGKLAVFLFGRSVVVAVSEWLIHRHLLRGGPVGESGLVHIKNSGSIGFNFRLTE